MTPPGGFEPIDLRLAPATCKFGEYQLQKRDLTPSVLDRVLSLDYQPLNRRLEFYFQPIDVRDRLSMENRERVRLAQFVDRIILVFHGGRDESRQITHLWVYIHVYMCIMSPGRNQ